MKLFFARFRIKLWKGVMCVLGRLEFAAGGRGKGELAELYGLPVLLVRTDPQGWFGKRRLERAGYMLRRNGAGRVLLPREFEGRELLKRFGLRTVDPAPFLRSQADRLAIAGLRRRDTAPERATVSLAGERADREMAQIAVRLCPGVRRLVIDAPGGEALGRFLREEFGMPVLPPGEPAQLELRFQPGAGTGQNPALELYGHRPDLDGGRLWHPALNEEEQDDPALLCALWEGGKLDVQRLKFT